MTLSMRNGLLLAAFIVLLLVALGYGALAFLLVSKEGWTAPLGQSSLVFLLAETSFVPVVSFVGFLILRRAYRKSTTSDTFFSALFVVCLSLESLLLVQAWIGFSGAASYYTAVLTRVVWAARFTGLALLLCGSLYNFDFAFRKYGNLVGGSLAAGILLSSLLPLQTTSARNHLLYAVADAPGMVLVTLLVSGMIAANYIMGALRAGAPPRAWRAAWSTIFFLLAWTAAIVFGPLGSLLAIPGIGLAAWKTETNPLTD